MCHLYLTKMLNFYGSFFTLIVGIPNAGCGPTKSWLAACLAVTLPGMSEWPGMQRYLLLQQTSLVSHCRKTAYWPLWILRYFFLHSRNWIPGKSIESLWVSQLCGYGFQEEITVGLRRAGYCVLAWRRVAVYSPLRAQCRRVAQSSAWTNLQSTWAGQARYTQRHWRPFFVIKAYLTAHHLPTTDGY